VPHRRRRSATMSRSSPSLPSRTRVGPREIFLYALRLLGTARTCLESRGRMAKKHTTIECGSSMWKLAYVCHEDRTPTCEPGMAALTKSCDGNQALCYRPTYRFATGQNKRCRSMLLRRLVCQHKALICFD
jgi:hypothetical protein